MSETVFYNSKNLVGVGNVGIGTTAPSTNFHVYGSTGVSTRVTCSGTTGSSGMILNGGNAGDFFIYQFGSTYSGGEKPGTWTVMRNDAGPITIQSTVGYGNYSGLTVATNNRVGIGSSTPNTELDVVGNMRIDQGYTYIGGSGGQNAAFALNYIDTVSSYKSLIFGRDNSLNNAGEVNFNYVGAGSTSNWLGLGFYANYPVAITAGGKMGIGITTPSAPLVIYNASSTGNDPAGSHLYCYNPTNSAGQCSIITTRIGGSSAGQAYYSLDVAGSYGFSFGMSGASSRLQFRNAWNFSGTEVFTILTSGNVGIGSTNPGNTLDVAGSLRASGAVVFSQSTTSPTCVIGASAGGNNSQTGILQVVGRASEYLAIGTSMNSTAGQTHVQFNNPNGAVGSITTSGTATAYNTGSDYRLKSNVVPMTDGLEVINKLDPVYFTFNNDPSEVCSGFIAHVLQEVIPQAVSGEKDAVNDDGSIKSQGVDSSFIVSFLVSAVQELAAKNTNLEQSLATATETVSSLETQLQTAQNDIDLLESRLAAIEALIGTNTSADTGTTSSGTRADALLAQV